VLLSVSLVRDAEGRPLFFISQIQDITRRKELEAERERLSSIVEATPDFVAIADASLRVQYLNEGARRLLGLGSEEDPAAASITGSHPGWAARRVLGEGIPTAIERGTWQGETALRARDGREVPVLQTIVAHRDTSGQLAYLSTIARDISDRKAYENRIEELAYHDPLTGLANRRLLIDRLERALIRAQRQGQSVGVLLLDLDRFKLVNDTFGHETGDVVLQAIARRLQQVVRRGDTLARLGGDEFVVVVEDLGSAPSVDGVARKILDAVARPQRLRGASAASSTLVLTTSIGISVYPDDGEDASTLLRHADAAMYQAKEAGGHRHRFFAPTMEAEARSLLELERALRDGLRRNRFRLHYQPIVELSSRRIAGVEALLRWDRPGHGLVGPAGFVPVLEQTGLIHPVGQWVLEATCRQARSWREAGLPNWFVAVNVSAKQLAEPNWDDLVWRALAASGLPAGDLVIELTETAFVDPTTRASEVLHRLREGGVKVAMDDFGTGWSSLSQLRTLPLDMVKIARDFVHNAVTQQVDAAIVEAVIEVAHRRGLEVVGEGVETEEQLAFLRRIGCDYAQGYLLGRPMPPDKVGRWVRADGIEERRRRGGRQGVDEGTA
jgi:diguanylate cyclase (GGDEF)-like protein/PAS domain S-box-containing protein